MILPQSKAIDAPSRIAAEGHAALGIGDTDRARACYHEAGKLIEASIANERKQSEKHLLRFLAASQYYHGGHYEKALALGRKIEARFLSGKTRDLLPQFMKDATVRAKSDYALKIRQAVLKLWNGAKYQAIIEIFQEHPYVVPAFQMAAYRALCCHRMKEYRAAALFFADAVRMSSQRPDVTGLSAWCAFALIAENKLSEAREYLTYLLKEIPHAFTFVPVSLLRYHEASAAKTEGEKRQLSQEQITYFEQAWDLYHRLPESQRDIQYFRDCMTVCAEAAVFGLLRLDQKERALEVLSQATTLNPSSQGPKKVLEIITTPNANVEEFVREQADRIAKTNESFGDLFPTAA